MLFKELKNQLNKNKLEKKKTLCLIKEHPGQEDSNGGGKGQT